MISSYQLIINRLGLLLLPFLALPWLLVNHSNAESVSFNGITLAPAIVNVDLQPGQVNAVFAINVSNTTDQPVTLDISSADFKSLNDTGGVAFLNTGSGVTKYGLASWLTTDNSITLEPGQTKTTAVTIENRDDLSPGGHYAAVLFRVNGNNKNSTANQVDINQVVSALVFVKKIGGERYSIDLQDLHPPTAWFSLPSNINLFFNNIGNTQAVPRGLVIISSPLSKEVARGIINTDSSLVLPESTKMYRTAITTSTGRAWLPGFYNVNIVYRYDGSSEPIFYNARLFYVNVWFWLICLGGLSVLVTATIRWRIWRQKLKKRKPKTLLKSY
jgi:hypothetical protein